MSMSPSRLDALDWASLEQHLDQYGYAIVRSLLSAQTCERLSALYSQTEPFRSQVIMARHGFGRGEYKYFSYPLPTTIERLRTALYSRLVPLANRWYERMHVPVRFPQPMPGLCSAVTLPANCGRHPCCCNTARRTTTACIRICTEI